MLINSSLGAIWISPPFVSASGLLLLDMEEKLTNLPRMSCNFTHRFKPTAEVFELDYSFRLNYYRWHIGLLERSGRKE